MNKDEKRIVITNCLNNRRLELSKVLLTETLTKGVEIGILSKEKCEALIYNCIHDVYTLNELHAISLTLNSIKGFVERLDSYQMNSGNEEKNKHLIKLAVELSRLGNIKLTDELLNEVVDIEKPEECIKYILNKTL